MEKNSRNRTVSLSYGVVWYYVCKYSNRSKKGYNCQKELKAIFHDNSTKVTLEETDHIHEDDPSNDASSLTKEIKDIILQGVKNRKTALQIQQEITVRFQTLHEL